MKRIRSNWEPSYRKPGDVRKRADGVCPGFGTSQIYPELPCIAPANIDLILDNIFEKDGKYRVIDCEWIFDFPVPVAFIIWRAINELYSSYPQLEQDCRMQELLEEYQITQEMSETFHKWGTYFAEHYVGANRVLHYSIPEIGISLKSSANATRRRIC